MSGDLPDIRLPLDEARAAISVGGPYGEVMATYVALGQAIEAADGEGCRELVDRLIRLDRWVDQAGEQRWALWITKYTTFGGGE